MKTRKFTTLILLVIILSSCGPEIRFEEPQPTGSRNLKKIPKEYWGLYINQTDSSLLKINANMITQIWDQFTTLSEDQMINEFDTIFLQDTLIQFTENLFLDFKIKGDSTIVHSYGSDTIYIISPNQLLRRQKGYLFLNYITGDSTWMVKLLSLQHGYIDIQDLVTLSEIDSLKEIMEIETFTGADSTIIDQYRLHPTRRDIKEILNHKRTLHGFRKI
jgi:hypothetical protein